MKRGTKITAVLLALIMAFALAACGGGDDGGGNNPGTPTPTPPGSNSTPIPLDEINEDDLIDDTFDYTGGLADGVVTNEPITLKVYQWALDNQTTDFANLWYYQKLEEMTGVKIDWTVIKESEWNERTNMMFVSGEYPDLIIRPNQQLNIENYGVNQGILVPLDGYIQANMPNYSSRLGMNNVTAPLRASDGRMYWLGYLIAQNINHEANWFINQTWLDKVGMDVPKTTDELTEVLKAFRDNKLGGDTTFPMSSGGEIHHQTQGIYTHFSMFGVPLQYFVYACIDDNDKVVFPGYMDGFREACEWLSMCWAEGLLDKDSLTQNDNDWNVKVNNDQVGFTTYLRLINTAWKNPDTIDNWVSILPPAGTSAGPTTPRILEVPEFGAVLTSANKHIPETLRWLDLQFSTEWMLIAANGPMADGPIDPCLFINDDGLYEVEYIPEDNGLYKYVPVSQGQFFAPGDYYFDVFQLPPHRIERRDYSKVYEDAGVVEKNSYMILARLVRPSTAEADEQQRLYTEINTFMKERIADFIINGVTDASWQKFVDDAKSVGVEKYVETYQRLYDVYLAAQKSAE